MKHKFKLLLALLVAIPALAQDGYWDKDRATTREIKLGAGDRTVVRTEDLPIGTTEVVYRITLLDDNQQIAGSLVSLLKAIPDPTGISQGSAGAVFLLSKVSGDDQCTYAVYNSAEAARKYQAGADTKEACFVQKEPVNKAAKLLSAKSRCVTEKSTALWFGIESRNWIMKQKIIVEAVPWVDRKLSAGWTVENRQSIVDLCKTSNLAQRMIRPDDFCVCILDKMQRKYTFTQFQALMAIEKSKAFKDFGSECLSDVPANKSILANIRNDAKQHFKNGKYDDAIRLLQSGIIESENATALDYNDLAMYFLYSKQYDKAFQALNKAQNFDEAELLVQLNLAHAYLLNGDFQKAKEIHKKYRSQNVTATQSWIKKAQSDIDAFEKAGITSPDFGRMRKYLAK